MIEPRHAVEKSKEEREVVQMICHSLIVTSRGVQDVLEDVGECRGDVEDFVEDARAMNLDSLPRHVGESHPQSTGDACWEEDFHKASVWAVIGGEEES